MLFTIIGLLAITANVVQGNVVPPKNQLESRIVDNNDVNIKEVPYQVSVRNVKNINLCVGTIINKRVVLVADIPLFSIKSANKFSIKYGSSEFGGETNVIGVQNILRYTNVTSYTNDIALMRLVSDIPFSAVAQPIPLASIAPAVGTYANVTGWGNFPENALALHQDSVQIANRSVCQEHFPEINTVDENLLCAVIERTGTDVCEYDVGSSLVSNGVLLGTYANGIGCDSGYYYGLFTNIAVYKSWIDSNVNAE